MITKEEFQELAAEFGATVIYGESCGAVFNGPRFCLTIELSERQMQKANANEVANMMAHAAMFN